MSYLLFIEGTKSHNAYSACTKCVVMGEYYNEGHHMSYPRFDCPLRTHQDFIDKKDEDHHLYDPRNKVYIRSPLEDIEGIDMIKSFPIVCT